MPGELRDGQSLYLAGGKHGAVWRIDYRSRADGRANTYTVGRHGNAANEFTLAKARAERDNVRSLLDKGFDPNITKRAEKVRIVTTQADTFALLADEWYASARRSRARSRRRAISPAA